MAEQFIGKVYLRQLHVGGPHRISRRSDERIWYDICHKLIRIYIHIYNCFKFLTAYRQLIDKLNFLSEFNRIMARILSGPEVEWRLLFLQIQHVLPHVFTVQLAWYIRKGKKKNKIEIINKLIIRKLIYLFLVKLILFFPQKKKSSETRDPLSPPLIPPHQILYDGSARPEVRLKGRFHMNCSKISDTLLLQNFLRACSGRTINSIPRFKFKGQAKEPAGQLASWVKISVIIDLHV